MRTRRGTLFVLTVGLSVLAACTAGLSTPAPGTPLPTAAATPAPPPTVPAYPPPTAPATPGTIDQVLDIAFVDALHGWALGSTCTQAEEAVCVPAISATADGGVTWQPSGAPATGVALVGEVGNSGHVRSLVFADAATGWAYGPGLFLTRDGGATWTALPQTEEIVALVPAGASLWAIGRTCAQPTECSLQVLTSTDQGRHWTPTSAQPASAGDEVQLIHPDPNTGWVLSSGPAEGSAQLSVTHDGGGSWDSQPLPCDEGRPEAARLAVEGQQLWLLCGGQPGAGQQEKSLYSSADAGADWTLAAATGQAGVPSLPGAGYVADLAVSAPQQLWMALARGSLYGSSDGGSSWTAAFSDEAALAGAGVTRVLFADAEHGWAVAQVAVYRTADGGTTWERVEVK